ncbi:MAG: O-antigen ligase family protein [Firmicutes bacterium]|nr:O-antigen ligase family protein [Bacillota bacterium]
MTDNIKSSLVYRFFAAIGNWFGEHWKNSLIVTAFLKVKPEEQLTGSSLFFRFFSRIRDAWAALFAKLKLNVLFRDSIFSMPFVWALPAVVLAPLIPTMAVLALVLMGFGTTLVCLGVHPEKRLQGGAINRYIFLYAILYLTATFTSVTVSGSLFIGLLTSAFILFVFVLEFSVDSYGKLKILVEGLVAAGLLVALYGVYQHYFGTSGTETWIDEDMFSDISSRVYSTLQNPNVLSEYLLLVIPLAAACTLAAKSWLKKAGYFAAFCVMCACMIFTYSRGGWLGLLFAAFVFMILLDRRTIFLMILGAVALMIISPETIIDRFSSIGNLSDSSTSYRVSIWMGVLSMLKDYWFTGIGPGTEAFNMVYPPYSYNTIAAPHSHNLYLQIICDTGICGIILFAIIIIVFIRTTCSALSREQDRTAKLLQISSLSGIGGFLVQSMTDYSFYNYRVMLMFWVYLSLSTIFCRMDRLRGQEKGVN